MKGCSAWRAALLALLWPAAVVAQTAGDNSVSIGDEDLPAVIRTGADLSDRITIPIRINGKGPYAFVIDTGAQRTVVSRQLARELALTDDGPVRILSMTGYADVNTVAVPNLSFGTTAMARIQAPVLEQEHLGGPGLLGLDGMSRKRLVMDFRSGRMDITPSGRRARDDEDAIVVEGKTRLGQLILVDSHADGRKVNVILDTGAQYSVGNMALLKKLSKRRPAAFAEQITLTSVTGDTLIGRWGYIDTISMGGVKMTHVPVVFADAGPFEELGLKDKPALMLGINVLRAFDRVAIDFGRRRIDFLLPDEGALAGPRVATLKPQAALP